VNLTGNFKVHQFLLFALYIQKSEKKKLMNFEIPGEKDSSSRRQNNGQQYEIHDHYYDLDTGSTYDVFAAEMSFLSLNIPLVTVLFFFQKPDIHKIGGKLVIRIPRRELAAIFICDIFRGSISVARASISKKSSKHSSVPLNDFPVILAARIAATNDFRRVFMGYACYVEVRSQFSLSSRTFSFACMDSLRSTGGVLENLEVLALTINVGRSLLQQLKITTLNWYAVLQKEKR
ncbi:hypothetical protein L9F63_023722, partial [Diploptera punctata]